MGSSVPGDSCRTSRCCAPTPNTGCVVRLPGQCVYYSGSRLTSVPINTGDDFNTVTQKISKISANSENIITYEEDGWFAGVPNIGANNGVRIIDRMVQLGDPEAGPYEADLLDNRTIRTSTFNLEFDSAFGTMNIGRDITNYSNSTFLGIRANQTTGSTGIVNILGYDSFRQALVLQSSSDSESGYVYQTIKAKGGLGGAMGIGVKFVTNAPDFFSIITNNAVDIVRVYNTDFPSSNSEPLRFVIGRAPTDTSQMLQVKGTGQFTDNVIFGGTVNPPTAKVHIAAGTTAAGTAPIKFTAGTNLTTPEDGAMEFDGSNLYITIAGVRRTINVT